MSRAHGSLFNQQQKLPRLSQFRAISYMQLLSKAWQIQLIFRAGSLWDVNSNAFPKLSPIQPNRRKAACLHFITLAFHTPHFRGYDSSYAFSQHRLSYEWWHAECPLPLKTHQHVLSRFSIKAGMVNSCCSSESEKAWSLLTYKYASFLFWVMKMTPFCRKERGVLPPYSLPFRKLVAKYSTQLL